MRLYVFFSVLEPFFARIATELQSTGVVGDVAGCVWGPRSVRLLEPFRIDRRNLLVMADVFGALPSTVDYDYLRSFEDPAMGITAGLLLTGDRVMESFSYERGLGHLEATLRAVERAFDRFSPAIVLMDDVSCVPSYAHYMVARKRGIPTLILGTSRLPGRLAIYANAYARFNEAEREYSSLIANGLGEAERDQARRYIADLARDIQKPPYMGYLARPAGFGWQDAKTLAKLVRESLFAGRDFTFVSPLRAARARLRRVINTQMFQRYWDAPVKGERYVLFPLHYQPEASTSVRAPYFVDQCALAENIARSLPVGYRLYIKEHPIGLGRRSVSEIKRLRRIPAARLIDPALDSLPLIAGAACVTTITGTAGWEALVRGIPTVTFGRVFYEACRNVHVAESPYEYPALFARALTTRPDPAETELFVAALLRTTFRGRIGHPYYMPEVLSSDNVTAIATHIRDTYLTPLSVTA